MFLLGGLKVVFLALVQSFSHYNNVAQKLVSIDNYNPFNYRAILLANLRHVVQTHRTVILRITITQLVD